MCLRSTSCPSFCQVFAASTCIALFVFFICILYLHSSIIWGCIRIKYLYCIVRHPAIFFLPGPRPPCPSAQVPPPAGESRHRFTVLGIILILIILILIIIITPASWFLTPHPAQIPTCWRERAWFQYRFQLPHHSN